MSITGSYFLDVHLEDRLRDQAAAWGVTPRQALCLILGDWFKRQELTITVVWPKPEPQDADVGS